MEHTYLVNVDFYGGKKITCIVNASSQAMAGIRAHSLLLETHPSLREALNTVPTSHYIFTLLSYAPTFAEGAD